MLRTNLQTYLFEELIELGLQSSGYVWDRAFQVLLWRLRPIAPSPTSARAEGRAVNGSQIWRGTFDDCFRSLGRHAEGLVEETSRSKEPPRRLARTVDGLPCAEAEQPAKLIALVSNWIGIAPAFVVKSWYLARPRWHGRKAAKDCWPAKPTRRAKTPKATAASNGPAKAAWKVQLGLACRVGFCRRSV